MTVKVKSSHGATKSWTLPRALLSHHSAYFQKLRNFEEGASNYVELTDFEPSIFQLFVQFLYYGRYTDTDDLKAHTKVRDSAKAWVLGNYLGVSGLRKFAIDSLIQIYRSSSTEWPPKSSFGPETVRFCCENSAPGSALYELYVGATAIYWRHRNAVYYNKENQEDWEFIWEDFPHFRNKLLWFMTHLPDDDEIGNTFHWLAKRVADIEKAQKH